MFNATQFVIDKVRRITQINLATGLVDFTGTSVESPQIEFTGESTDKTDAQGVLLARFDTAKGVNFSGELSLLNLNLMGAQLGSEVQVADSSKKVKGADFAILTVTDNEGTKTATKTVPISTLNSWAETFSNILSIPVYWHSLRHFFTTSLAKANLPDSVIKTIIGWESLEMVDIYKDIDDEDEIGKYCMNGEIVGQKQAALSDL